MWLLEDRHLRTTARRALLSAACLLACALTAWAQEGGALREKDVRRAEKVLAKLVRLGEAGGDDDAAFRALARDFYPGLRETVADMRESDLKTDLDTAVFLYEEMGRTWFTSGAAAADCARERADTYLPLCRALRGGSSRQLLRAKARLHARWAAAVVRQYRHAPDAETAEALSEMKAAREVDLFIAGRVVETLWPLEALAGHPPRDAAWREAGLSRPDGEFAEALDAAAALLGWLPRGPAFYRLAGARRSYRDGLYWHAKLRQSESLVVSALNFRPDELKTLSLDPDLVHHTTAANFKAAAARLRLAPQTLPPADRPE